MTRLLAVLLLVAVHSTAWAQAVAPRPAPVLPPPAYTPGYAPGTPAEPVYTPQGAGAYRGDPLHTTPVPRSPNKRILPATKEAGVWAADGEVRAAADEPPSIFGVPIPPPTGAAAFNLAAIPDLCGLNMSVAMGLAGMSHVMSLPAEVRACMAAEAYAECAAFYATKESLPKQRGFAPPWRPELVARSWAEHAAEVRRQLCKVGLTVQQRKALYAILEKWKWNRAGRDD